MEENINIFDIKSKNKTFMCTIINFIKYNSNFMLFVIIAILYSIYFNSSIKIIFKLLDCYFLRNE